MSSNSFKRLYQRIEKKEINEGSLSWEINKFKFFISDTNFKSLIKY